MLVDGIELSEGSNFKNLTVASGTDFPASADQGELFFKTTDQTLYVFNGTVWVGLGVTATGVSSVSGRTGIVVISASDIADLSAVASSGAYADLSGAPLIPSVVSSLVNDAGYRSSIQVDNSINAAIAAVLGAADGAAKLGSDQKLLASQLPAIAITDVFAVASQSAMLALTAQRGDVAIRSDLNKSFILSTDSPTVVGDWLELKTPTDAVLSVNGMTGAVTISAGGAVAGENTQLQYNNAGVMGAHPGLTFNGSDTLQVGYPSVAGIIQAASSSTGGEDLTIQSGRSTGSGGRNGNINITVPQSSFGGGASEVGGSISITAGANTGNLTDGGSINVLGGPSNNGKGGTLTLTGGTAGGYLGSKITLGGANSPASTGGSFVVSTASLTTLQERFRILPNGAWSIGNSGTGYGTSGQVLTSNGNGEPNWANIALGNATIVGNGLAEPVIQSKSNSAYPGLTLRAGVSSGGQGGSVKILGAGANVSGQSGGAVVITAGSGADSGSGGVVNITAGMGQDNRSGGTVFINGGGNYSPGTGVGGNIILAGGVNQATAAGGYIMLKTAASGDNLAERFRLLATGAWSVGPNGTDYGTAGQVLTSNGNAAPSWATPSAPTTVTGNAGSATKLQTARSIALTGDVTGTVSFDGQANVSIATTLKGDVVSTKTFTGAVTCNYATEGSYVKATVTGATTLSITGVPDDGRAYGMTFKLTNAGTNITWPASVVWLGTAPALRATGISMVTLTTDDGGTTWYGSAA